MNREQQDALRMKLQGLKESEKDLEARKASLGKEKQLAERVGWVGPVGMICSTMSLLSAFCLQCLNDPSSALHFPPLVSYQILLIPYVFPFASLSTQSLSLLCLAIVLVLPLYKHPHVCHLNCVSHFVFISPPPPPPPPLLVSPSLPQALFPLYLASSLVWCLFLAHRKLSNQSSWCATLRKTLSSSWERPRHLSPSLKKWEVGDTE